MFGYVKPLQGELKVYELQTYKAIYCGLCKQLGRSGGQQSRFLLSYDMTFLALVALSLSEEEPHFEAQRCMVHPLRKRQTLLEHPALSFAADTALLLAYYQCRDNIKDSRGLSRVKYRLALLLTIRGKKKAQKRRPKLFEILKNYEVLQQNLERSDNPSVDESCDPTGVTLGKMAELLAPTPSLKPALYRVGYMMGRYIYLMDAVDDLQSDLTHHRFNPLLPHFSITSTDDLEKNAHHGEIIEMLNLTIGQLVAAFELLPHYRYHSILENIIYLGLPDVRNRVLQKKAKKEKQNEQSL